MIFDPKDVLPTTGQEVEHSISLLHTAQICIPNTDGWHVVIRAMFYTAASHRMLNKKDKKAEVSSSVSAVLKQAYSEQLKPSRKGKGLCLMYTSSSNFDHWLYQIRLCTEYKLHLVFTCANSKPGLRRNVGQ